jgi:hypothetical protein
VVAGATPVLVHNTGPCLPSPAEAQEMIKNATPVGSARKTDALHRAPNFMVDDIAEKGTVYKLVGGDGISRVLVQMPGEVNGKAGRFEWILEGDKLTHSYFVQGGTMNGIPNKR